MKTAVVSFHLPADDITSLMQTTGDLQKELWYRFATRPKVQVMIAGGISYTLEPYDPADNAAHTGRIRTAIDIIKATQAALQQAKNNHPTARVTGLIGETHEPR
jgi:hypothetical protein